jgi:hypothetical protein
MAKSASAGTARRAISSMAFPAARAVAIEIGGVDRTRSFMSDHLGPLRRRVFTQLHASDMHVHTRHYVHDDPTGSLDARTD